jgi:hypothetical protein
MFSLLFGRLYHVYPEKVKAFKMKFSGFGVRGSGFRKREGPWVAPQILIFLNPER